MGGLIFIVKYNGAFLWPPVPRSILGPIQKSKYKSVKFVDDGTVAVSVDLKAKGIPDPIQRPTSSNYHERTRHVLPKRNNMLQYYIEDTEYLGEPSK